MRARPFFRSTHSSGAKHRTLKKHSILRNSYPSDSRHADLCTCIFWSFWSLWSSDFLIFLFLVPYFQYIASFISKLPSSIPNWFGFVLGMFRPESHVHHMCRHPCLGPGQDLTCQSKVTNPTCLNSGAGHGQVDLHTPMPDRRSPRHGTRRLESLQTLDLTFKVGATNPRKG